jgi:hypothetical protein
MCLARRRPSHRIHAPPPRRGHLFFFIVKNVDMGELIQHLIRTKVPPPAYHRIQEFVTKVCVVFICFLHSYYEIQYLFSHLSFFGFFLYRLEWVVLDQTPNQRFTRALICSLQMRMRTCRCSTLSSVVPAWNNGHSTYFKVLFVCLCRGQPP